MDIEAVAGMVFTVLFAALIGGFWALRRFVKDTTRPSFRKIEAFTTLPYDVGNAVESGKRLYVTLGSGSIFGPDTASALAGITILDVLAETGTVSDKPAMVTAGDPTTMILAQDTLRRVYRRQNALELYDHDGARLAGITPFSYAGGAMMTYKEEDVATALLLGQFGEELPLIAAAGARQHAQQIVGTGDPRAQALAFVTADHPLIGEDVYAGGAYLVGGQPAHHASLQAQDVLRLLLALILVGGGLLGLVSRLF